MPPLDEDRCYAAAASRDARFDGHFVTAVKTTKIYCRPSCPAITPKRHNVEFHLTAAAAQQRGFRACKRCLPDATPGSPEWDMRRDVVARAMRLISDGEIDRVGVAGLATRLGYSTRHLNRLLTDDLGAGPLAIARAQRAHTARVLIETTDMRLTDVAFAAGFGSIRQFNDTIREVYALPPTELRQRSRGRTTALPVIADGSATTLRLRLPCRGPFACESLGSWFAARAVEGVESVATSESGWVHQRTLRAPNGAAHVTTRVSSGPDVAIHADVTLEGPSDLAAVVHRVRRMYDLDADPVAVDDHLRRDPVLARHVERRPGLRCAGSVDPFETVVRAVIGQQVSVSGARTVTARLVDAVSPLVPFDINASCETTRASRLFPTPAQVLDAPDDAFAMPDARRETIRSVATAVADGRVTLDAGADPAEARGSLLALAGIGPWTADYVVLRGLGDPDVSLSTDLIIARTAEQLGVRRADLDRHATEHWAPWRSYAMHHLWSASADLT